MTEMRREAGNSEGSVGDGKDDDGVGDGNDDDKLKDSCD
jgi:hypothetical protein